jgi:hypothetical protein
MMSPPWERAMSRAIASPSPLPPSSGCDVFEPQERLEHVLAQMGGNAGAVVVDGDGEIAVVALAGISIEEPNRAALETRLARQLERVGTHGDDGIAVEARRRLVAVALGVGPELFEESRHVGRLDCSPASPRAKAR